MQKPIIYVPDENTAVRNNELLIINENSLYRWFSAWAGRAILPETALAAATAGELR